MGQISVILRCDIFLFAYLVYLAQMANFEKLRGFVLTESVFCGTIYSARTNGFRSDKSDARIGKNKQIPARDLCRTAKNRKITKSMKNRLTKYTEYGIIGSAKIQDIALPVFMYLKAYKIWEAQTIRDEWNGNEEGDPK